MVDSKFSHYPFKNNIFNIPAGYNFLESLYLFITEKYQQKVKILLNNQLAINQFQQILLNNQDRKALIMPNIRSIGDISYRDLIDNIIIDKNNHLLIKEKINHILSIKSLPKIDFMLFLVDEIGKNQQLITNFNSDKKTIFESSKIAMIANDLIEIYSQIVENNIDIADLLEINNDNLSQHRLRILDFLERIFSKIKNTIIKQQILDFSSYQNLVINSFIDVINNSKFKNHLIIAGSTGSTIIGRKLIKAIAKHQQGVVIMQSLNLSLLEESFLSKKIPNHNSLNYLPYQLISDLSLDAGFAIEKSSDIEANNISSFISDIKYQSQLINDQDFVDFSYYLSDLDSNNQQILNIDRIKNKEITARKINNNINLIIANNIIDESRKIAFSISKFYLNGNSNKNVGVVINDDNFGNLLINELKIRNINFIDSRNIGIKKSSLLILVDLLLNFVKNDIDLISLLAIFKHPIIINSYKKLLKLTNNDYQDIIANFEITIAREAIPANNIDELITYITLENIDNNLTSAAKELFLGFYNHIKPLRLLYKKHNNINDISDFTLKELCDAIKSCLINLSGSDFRALLSGQNEGLELLELFDAMFRFGDIKLKIFEASSFIDIMAGNLNFFGRKNKINDDSNQEFINNIPIYLLSTIEARLLNFDLLVVSNLDAEKFPKKSSSSWLGKKIDYELGIDRKFTIIGQNSYDFYNYLNNSKVILSYHINSDNKNKLPSILLSRLAIAYYFIIKNDDNKIDIRNVIDLSILQKDISDKNYHNNFIMHKSSKNFVRSFDFIDEINVINISQIDDLLRNPYLFYCKNILKLRNLNNINYHSGKREFGIAIHYALQFIINNYSKNGKLSNIRTKEESAILNNIFEKYFVSNLDKILYYHQFFNLIDNFYQNFCRKYQLYSNDNKLKFFTEVDLAIGSNIDINKKMLINNHNFRINGRIDLIIYNNDKSPEITIIDYKTGSNSNENNPQLLFLAIIAEYCILYNLEFKSSDIFSDNIARKSLRNLVFSDFAKKSQEKIYFTDAIIKDAYYYYLKDNSFKNILRKIRSKNELDDNVISNNSDEFNRGDILSSKIASDIVKKFADIINDKKYGLKTKISNDEYSHFTCRINLN
jgi:inactivated superfamily I helicase